MVGREEERVQQGHQPEGQRRPPEAEQQRAPVEARVAHLLDVGVQVRAGGPIEPVASRSERPPIGLGVSRTHPEALTACVLA